MLETIGIKLKAKKNDDNEDNEEEDDDNNEDNDAWDDKDEDDHITDEGRQKLAKVQFLLDFMTPLLILSHAQSELVIAQPNTGLSAIDPDFHHSTTVASAPVSTSDTSTRGPSTPATILLIDKLVVTSHAPIPNHCPSTQPPPSTSPLSSPLSPVPSLRPNTAVFYIGTSRKHMLDGF
ncbi:hypothetical protein DFJ58DRAFT_729524 [Suillus subalutaceus]|uniref:uncharacterized protein n=1 Tax=Suillus subalutaceus TaxID=48586 RepID=UPI001B880699|nr:uncharacterized protein DFJ58DRAFT_729524 [Suillus subalutaceus]KAG1849439.1 hypothetical protein DFJ58DRAFT_729524 [Suillus subalutaceus]